MKLKRTSGVIKMKKQDDCELAIMNFSGTYTVGLKRRCCVCQNKIGIRGSLGSDEIDGVEIRNEDFSNDLLGCVCLKCAKKVVKQFIDLVD